MSVSTVTKYYDGWEGSDAIGSKRAFTVVYLVTCDNASDGPDVVLGAGTLPSVGSAYNNFGNDVDASAYLKDRKVKRRTLYQWEVTCIYGTPDSDSGNDDGKPRGVDENGDPVDDLDLEADDISVDIIKMTRVAESGILRGRVSQNAFIPGPVGKAQIIPSGVRRAITNSANVVYDPPVIMDYTRMVLRITRNDAAYNADLYKPFLDTVNSVAHTINRIGFTLTIEPYTGKCEAITTQRVRRGIQIRYRTTFEFHIDDVFGWRVDLLDKGFQQTPDANDIPSGYQGIPLEKITDIDGSPVNEPVLLDGQGQRLGIDGQISIQDSIFLRYSLYEELSWAQLGIWD